ncbi:Heavy metal-associated isoprenylated plant protein 26 [Apostasia shenzhenica]|uniref:Heavy metal-associated isoprenylated plant protein 26 n=1 Tax=Apostasia shenzhenica TaxID=1088818 RepID=A0A2I0ARA9_9ASPA|nr:Heavy metal-associated isoprenylated plant protein 26 [Apostasia shenzhenica]
MGISSSLPRYNQSHKKRRQLQTIELKVRMDCEGCELKVKKALSHMKGFNVTFMTLNYKMCNKFKKISLLLAGVQSVEINRKQNKVTVSGYIEPNRVLKRVMSTGKKAEIWPYVPYNLVMHPYVAGTYDKRAPPGYVRNVEAITVQSQAIRQEDHLTNLFSDDNPNACSIM